MPDSNVRWLANQRTPHPGPVIQRQWRRANCLCKKHSTFQQSCKYKPAHKGTNKSVGMGQSMLKDSCRWM